MKELKEQLAKKLYEDFYLMVVNDKQREIVAENFADKILSSHTNLRAERECDQCTNGFTMDVNGEPRRCLMCVDHPGFISRPLTLQEKAEIPDMLLDGRAKFFETSKSGLDDYVYRQAYILLPSGERIVIARDKEE